MADNKTNQQEQSNDHTADLFVPESEYGGKGGRAHAKPSGPMKTEEEINKEKSTTGQAVREN